MRNHNKGKSIMRPLFLQPDLDRVPQESMLLCTEAGARSMAAPKVSFAEPRQHGQYHLYYP